MIDNFYYVASDTSPPYEIWRYFIFKDLGDTECRYAANAVVLVHGEWRVSNFNSKVPHIQFERNRLSIFRVRVFTSSGSTGGHRNAKTIISPNTSFGDIIMSMDRLTISKVLIL